MAEQRCVSSDPIFLCGVGRSGTTYTLTLLNALSGVHLSDEGRMLKEGIGVYREMKDPAERRSFDKLLCKLVESESETRKNRALIDVVNEEADALFVDWQKERSYQSLIRNIYFRAFGKNVWGDKLLRAEYASILLDLWPSVRFLFIFRDPKAVASSQKVKWKVPVYSSANYWNTHYNLCMKVREVVPEQVLVMKYEDLLNTPEQCLQEIVCFFSIEDSDINEVLKVHPPELSTLKKYEEVLTSKEKRLVDGLCFNNMNAMGYSPAYAEKKIETSRLRYFVELIWVYRHYLSQPKKLFRKNLFSRLRTMLRNV